MGPNAGTGPKVTGLNVGTGPKVTGLNDRIAKSIILGMPLTEIKTGTSTTATNDTTTGTSTLGITILINDGILTICDMPMHGNTMGGMAISTDGIVWLGKVNGGKTGGMGTGTEKGGVRGVTVGWVTESLTMGVCVI